MPLNCSKRLAIALAMASWVFLTISVFGQSQEGISNFEGPQSTAAVMAGIDHWTYLSDDKLWPCQATMKIETPLEVFHNGTKGDCTAEATWFGFFMHRLGYEVYFIYMKGEKEDHIAVVIPELHRSYFHWHNYRNYYFWTYDAYMAMVRKGYLAIRDGEAY